MTEKEKKQILLLGLDDRMLWQLTRVLTMLDDKLDIHCATDFSVAKEISKAAPFHLIVIDGWEHSWQADYLFGSDDLSQINTGKWLILVDSIPLEGLLDDRVAAASVFLEKPFNPKEFPAFIMNLIDKDAGEAREGAGARDDIYREGVETRIVNQSGAPDPLALPLAPGETYLRPSAASGVTVRVPEAVVPGVPETSVQNGEKALPASEFIDPVKVALAEDEAERPPPEQTEGPDFHYHLDMGFSCLKEKDWTGVRENWMKALELRPQDKRLRANLRHLGKMV